MPNPLEPRFDILPAALLATKLRAICNRAEAKNYRDIAQMLGPGVPLSLALSVFRAMFRGEPAEALRALGYFEDGDLPSLTAKEQAALRAARDRVGQLPEVSLRAGLLPRRAQRLAASSALPA